MAAKLEELGGDHKSHMRDDIEECTFEKFAKTNFQAKVSHYFSGDVLKSPLLPLKARIHQQMALRIWVVLLRFMVLLHEPAYLAIMKEHEATDVAYFIKDPPKSDEEMVQFIINYGTYNPELRDEIYCQLCKQLTKNSNNQSYLKGWELLCLCVGCFFPSENFQLVNYLRNFIREGPSDYASYCEERLERTIKNGGRLLPPGSQEIMAIKSKKPLKLSVKFSDGNTIMVSVDSATTVRELCLQIAESISLVDWFGFVLKMEYCNEVARLGSGWCVMDAISGCELVAISRGENLDVTSCKLSFHKKIFAPWQPSKDPVATDLIYNQVVKDVKSGKLGYEEDDDLVMMITEQNVNVKEDIVSYARNKLTLSFSLFWSVSDVVGPSLQEDSAHIAVNCTGLHVVDKNVLWMSWNGECFVKLPFTEVKTISNNRTDTMYRNKVTIQTVKGDQYTFTTSPQEADEIKYIVEAIQTPPSKQDHFLPGPTDSDDVINAGISRMTITPVSQGNTGVGVGPTDSDDVINAGISRMTITPVSQGNTNVGVDKLPGRPGKLSCEKMPGHQFDVLRQSHIYLLEQLTVEPMVDYLFQKHILDDNDLDRIKTAQRTLGRRASLDIFLDILRHSGDQAYPTLLHVLEMNEVGLQVVADSLRKCERQLAPNAPTNWQKGPLLGAGAFGKVYKCCDKDSGHDYAVKMVELGEPNAEISKEVEALENELQLLRNIRHERIVQYFGSQNDGKVLSIFIEYMPGGSVKKLINDLGKLEESIVRKYTRQVLLGLAYLHSNDIVHRDIKADNILRDTKGNVKLGDFGISKRLQTIRIATGLRTVVGTPNWMAPEVIKAEAYAGKADIWSLACTVVEMLSGKPLFHELDPHQVMFQIAFGEGQPNYKLPEKVSGIVREFLSLAFKRAPVDRWSAESLLKHKFVQET